MNRKVLIVDDERSIVDILRYNLEKNDMTAVCALSLIHILASSRSFCSMASCSFFDWLLTRGALLICSMVLEKSTAK